MHEKHIFKTWKIKIFYYIHSSKTSEHWPRLGISQNNVPLQVYYIHEINNLFSICHSLKIARLDAHHWKKLKFSMSILTFLVIPNEFWKGIGSVWRSISELSHKMGQIWSIKFRAQFLYFQKFVNSGVIFAIKSCWTRWLNIIFYNLEICWRKTWYFLKIEKMPEIVLPISVQIDNSIDWNLRQNKTCWYVSLSYKC